MWLYTGGHQLCVSKLKLPQDDSPPRYNIEQGRAEGLSSIPWCVQSSLQLEGRRLLPLWPSGCPVYGQTVLEKTITEQGNFHAWTNTSRLTRRMPIWTHYKQVYGFIFALYPLLKDSLQWLWYVVISLQLDKVDFSWHGHDPPNIGYLRRRLPC